jgi:hypothetical protein
MNGVAMVRSDGYGTDRYTEENLDNKCDALQHDPVPPKQPISLGRFPMLSEQNHGHVAAVVGRGAIFRKS